MRGVENMKKIEPCCSIVQGQWGFYFDFASNNGPIFMNIQVFLYFRSHVPQG
jgi:hypothetical protein